MTQSGPAKKTSVMIVDDHPVLRQGLRQMIGQEADLEVCCEAGTVGEALEHLESGTPDLVTVDIALGEGDGLELVKQIVSRWPSVFILVLSMHSEKLYAERALRAGAHGYIMKQEAPEKVVEAIRRVRDGGVVVSEELQARWLQRVVSGKEPKRTAIETLTDRELAVFRLVGSGRSTRDIAEQLHLSVKTVESYRENIKEKLGIGSATELIQQATLWVRNSSNG
jgi:DNA-binding NarL/FixJ family response regulator